MEKKIIIQGLGNVGYHAAKFLEERWSKNYWNSGKDGAILSENGMNVESVYQYKQENGKVEDFLIRNLLGRVKIFWSIPVMY